MRHVRMLGGCLAVICAVVALTGTEASAKLPEWGKCEPTAGGTGGKYANAGCTQQVKKVYGKLPGGYEWYPLVEGKEGANGAEISYPGFDREIEQPVHSMSITLASGYKITCGGMRPEASVPLFGTSAPELSFGSEAGFTGSSECVNSETGQSCFTSDAVERGEIDTTAAHELGKRHEPGSWTGTARFIEDKHGSEPKVGIVYKTEESRGHFIAPIGCEGAVHTILIGGDKKNETLAMEIEPLNTMSTEYTAYLRQSGGVQLPTSLEGHAVKPLEAQINAENWQTVGIEATMLFPEVTIEGPNNENGELELKATP